jgi:hypothetical protein
VGQLYNAEEKVLLFPRIYTPEGVFMKIINFSREYAFAHKGINVVVYKPGPVEFENADPELIEYVIRDKAGVVIDPEEDAKEKVDAEAAAKAEAEALAKAEAEVQAKRESEHKTGHAISNKPKK